MMTSMSNFDVNKLIADYKKLSDEEKKEVFKKLYLSDFAISFARYKILENYGGQNIHDIDINDIVAYRYKVKNSFYDQINKIFLQLTSDDETLRNRLFEKLFTNYEHMIAEEKEEICNKVGHVFTEWKSEKSDKIGSFDMEGCTFFYRSGTVYERHCKYCSLCQIASSENEKNILEKSHGLARKRNKNEKNY